MFSNLIIGLVELVHEEERVRCKKISVGVYKLQNTCRKVMVIFEKKKNDENERKRMRKKGRKRHDEMLKVRIGG